MDSAMDNHAVKEHGSWKSVIENYFKTEATPSFNHFVTTSKDDIVEWSLVQHNNKSKDQLRQLWKQRFRLAALFSEKALSKDALNDDEMATWEYIKAMITATTEASDKYGVSGMKALTEMANKTEERFAKMTKTIAGTSSHDVVGNFCCDDDVTENAITSPINSEATTAVSAPGFPPVILNPPKPSPGSLSEFTKNFEDMDEKYKWRLASGRCVEDILYGVGIVQKKESICHSFVLDISDSSTKNAFTDDEWKQILDTNVKADITLDKDVAELLEALDKKTVCEINEVVAEKLPHYLRMPREQAFDLRQICYAVLSLTMLYEMPSSPLTSQQLELWYECNVWVPLLDKLYGDIHNVLCIRGESANLSTKRRKSRDGTGDAGVKYDFIVRNVGRGHLLEFAYGETSCGYHDEADDKHTYEALLKVPKTLRDIWFDLAESVDWNRELVKKIEVVGYVHEGLVAQHLILDNPAGYVCRLTRSKKRQIPAVVEEFKMALQVIAINVMLKNRLRRTIATICERPLALDQLTSNQLASSPTIPPTFTTPTRNQNKNKKRSIQNLYA